MRLAMARGGIGVGGSHVLPLIKSGSSRKWIPEVSVKPPSGRHFSRGKVEYSKSTHPNEANGTPCLQRNALDSYSP